MGDDCQKYAPCLIWTRKGSRSHLALKNVGGVSAGQARRFLLGGFFCLRSCREQAGDLEEDIT